MYNSAAADQQENAAFAWQLEDSLRRLERYANLRMDPSTLLRKLNPSTPELAADLRAFCRERKLPLDEGALQNFLDEANYMVRDFRIFLLTQREELRLASRTRWVRLLIFLSVIGAVGGLLLVNFLLVFISCGLGSGVFSYHYQQNLPHKKNPS